MNFPNDANADIIRFEPSGYSKSAIIPLPEFSSSILEANTYATPYTLERRNDMYFGDKRDEYGFEDRYFNSKVFADGEDLYILNYRFNEDFDRVKQTVSKYNGSGLFVEWEYELSDDEFHINYLDHLEYAKDRDIFQSYDVSVNNNKVVLAYNVSPLDYNQHLYNYVSSGVHFLHDICETQHKNLWDSGFYSVSNGNKIIDIPSGVPNEFGNMLVWASSLGFGGGLNPSVQWFVTSKNIYPEYMSLFRGATGFEAMYNRLFGLNPLDARPTVADDSIWNFASGVDRPYSTWSVLDKNTGELLSDNKAYSAVPRLISDRLHHTRTGSEFNREVLAKYDIYKPIFNEDGAAILTSFISDHTSEEQRVRNRLTFYGSNNNRYNYQTGWSRTHVSDSLRSYNHAQINPVLSSGNSSFGEDGIKSSVLVNGQYYTSEIMGIGLDPLEFYNRALLVDSDKRGGWYQHSFNPHTIDIKHWSDTWFGEHANVNGTVRNMASVLLLSSGHNGIDDVVPGAIFDAITDEYNTRNVRTPCWFNSELSTRELSHTPYFNRFTGPTKANYQDFSNDMIIHSGGEFNLWYSGQDINILHWPNYILNPFRYNLDAKRRLNSTGKFMNNHIYINCPGANSGTIFENIPIWRPLNAGQPSSARGYVVDVVNNSPICKFGCVKFNLPSDVYERPVGQTLPMSYTAYEFNTSLIQVSGHVVDIVSASLIDSEPIFPIDVAENEFKMVYKRGVDSTGADENIVFYRGLRYPESGVENSLAEEWILLDNYGNVVSKHNQGTLLNSAISLVENLSVSGRLDEQAHLVMQNSGSYADGGRLLLTSIYQARENTVYQKQLSTSLYGVESPNILNFRYIDYGFCDEGFLLHWNARFSRPRYIPDVFDDDVDMKRDINVTSVSYDETFTSIIGFDGNARTIKHHNGFSLFRVPDNASGVSYIADSYCESPIVNWTPPDRDTDWNQFYNIRMSGLYPEVDE